jgi:hypothetical protein
VVETVDNLWQLCSNRVMSCDVLVYDFKGLCASGFKRVINYKVSLNVGHSWWLTKSKLTLLEIMLLTCDVMQ